MMLVRAWLVLSDMNDWARHHGRRQDRPCLGEACHRVWAAELSNITKIIKSQLQQLKQERWYHLLWVMRDILFVFNWNINQLLKKLIRRQWDERGNEKGRDDRNETEREGEFRIQPLDSRYPAHCWDSARTHSDTLLPLLLSVQTQVASISACAIA